MILEDFPRISDCDWELNKTFELQPIQGALKDATFLDYDSWQNFLMVGDFEHKALVYKLDGEGNMLETIPVEGERVYTTFDTIGRIYSCATTPDFSALIIGGGDISDSTIGFAKWYTIDEDQHIEFANELYMDNNNTPFDGRVTKVVISPHGQYAILIGNFTGYAKLYIISQEGVLYLTDVPLDDDETPLDGAVQDAAFFPGRTADNYFLVGGAFTGKLIRCRYVSNHWASNKVLDFNNTVNAIIFSKRKVSGSAYGLAIGGAFDGYAFYYLTTNSGVSYTLKAQVYDSGNVPLSSPVISGASCYGEDIFVLNSSSDTLVERKGRVYGFASSQVNYISDYLTGSIIWDVKFSSDNTKLIASCDTGVYIYGLGDGSTVTISDSNRYQITQEMSYPMCGDFTDFGSKMIIGGDELKEFETGVAYTGIREIYRSDGSIRGETFKFNSTGRYGIKYTQGQSLLQVYWFDEDGGIISIDDWDQAGTAYNGVIQGAFFDPTEKVIFVYGGNEENSTGFMYTLMRKNGADDYTFATSNSYQSPVLLVEASPYVESYSDHPMYHIVVAVGYYMIREGVAVYEDTVGYGNFSNIETSNPGTPVKIVFSPNNEYIAVLYGTGSGVPTSARLYDYSTFLCTISAARHFNNCAFLNNNTQIVLWMDYPGILTTLTANEPLLYSISHSTTTTKCTMVTGIGFEIFGTYGFQLGTAVDESRNLVYCVLGRYQSSRFTDIRAVAYLINTDNTCTYLYDFYDGKNDEAFEYGNYTGLPKNLYLSQDKKTLTLGKFVYPLNIPTTESIHIANIYDITDDGVVFRGSVPNSELLPAMTQVNCQALAENKVGLTAFGINSSSSIPSYGQIIAPVWDNSIVTQEEIYADNGTLELQGSLSRCKYFEYNGQDYVLIVGDILKTKNNSGGSLYKVLDHETLSFVCNIPYNADTNYWNGKYIDYIAINQYGEFFVVRDNSPSYRFYNFVRNWDTGEIARIAFIKSETILDCPEFTLYEDRNGHDHLFLHSNEEYLDYKNNYSYQWHFAGSLSSIGSKWARILVLPRSGNDWRIVAVGNSGIAISDDNGASWSSVVDSGYNFSDIVAITVDKLVAVGGKNIFMSQDGGETFEITATLTGNYRGIAFYSNDLVLVGDSGATAYSSDGINWTENASLSSHENYTDVVYGNYYRYYVAVGNAGKIAYSSDGRFWNELDFYDSNIVYKRVAYDSNNHRFVAVGYHYIDDTYIACIAYSDTGYNWTRIDTELLHKKFNDIRWIDYARGSAETNGRFFVTCLDTPDVYESIDGIHWWPQKTNDLASMANTTNCIGGNGNIGSNVTLFGIFNGAKVYQNDVNDYSKCNFTSMGSFFDINKAEAFVDKGAKLNLRLTNSSVVYPTDTRSKDLQIHSALVVPYFLRMQGGAEAGIATFSLSENSGKPHFKYCFARNNSSIVKISGDNDLGMFSLFDTGSNLSTTDLYSCGSQGDPLTLISSIANPTSSGVPFNVFNRSGDGLLIGYNGEPQIYKANSDASSYTYVNSIYDALPKGWSFTSSSAIYSGIDLPDNESTVSIQVKYKNLTSNPWVDILTSVNYDDTSKELKIKLSPSKFLTLFTNCDIKFKFYNS